MVEGRTRTRIAGLDTYSIVTTATDDVRRVHDRMPMSAAVGRWRAWPDRDLTDTDQASEPMARRRPAWRSTRLTTVNNAPNNGSALLDPIPDRALIRTALEQPTRPWLA